MKRFLLAAAVAALTAATADAGPLRNLAHRVRCGDGPVRQAVRHVVEARPVRSVAAAVIELPARVVEARPLARVRCAVARAFAFGPK